jgi:hypothetical protein
MKTDASLEKLMPWFKIDTAQAIDFKYILLLFS